MREMQSTLRGLLSVILGVMFAGIVSAQVPSPAATSSEVRVEAKEGVESEPTPSPPVVPKKVEPPRERFAPSEQVPVGDAVSFPVDI